MPVDGVIQRGHTNVNEAMLTGESAPIEKAEGDDVIGGSLNGAAAITIKVTKTGEDTYVSQVVEMVRSAQEARSRTQDFANRAALWLTLIAISAGLGTFIGWIVANGNVAFTLERAVTVMVITCPHALGLAIPLVVAVSTALGAKSGLLIRDRSAFERARSLDTVVFDKTGTLTEGGFAVTDVVPFAEAIDETLLLKAAAIEAQSEHPIAQAIVRRAKILGISTSGANGVSEKPGMGVEGRLKNETIKVVSPKYVQESGLKVDHSKTQELETQGKTIAYVIVDNDAIGVIALADTVRKTAPGAIRKLKNMGLEVIMLTGDGEDVARWVSERIGLDRYFAEVLPDRKAEIIRKLKSDGRVVAMVGDGVNDAPALVAADVGIGIGAGTDVAVEAADIVLVHSDPRDVVGILQLARSTYRKMVQNLWWAAGYNIVAIPLAAGALSTIGVLLSPAAGAALMSLSTVIVAINARLLGKASRRSALEQKLPAV